MRVQFHVVLGFVSSIALLLGGSGCVVTTATANGVTVYKNASMIATSSGKFCGKVTRGGEAVSGVQAIFKVDYFVGANPQSILRVGRLDSEGKFCFAVNFGAVVRVEDLDLDEATVRIGSERAFGVVQSLTLDEMTMKFELNNKKKPYHGGIPAFLLEQSFPEMFASVNKPVPAEAAQTNREEHASAPIAMMVPAERPEVEARAAR